MLVDCFLEEGWSIPGKSEVVVERFCFTTGGDLLVTCPCGVLRLVPDKSDFAVGLVVGRMNGSEDLTAPTGGGWVGVTLGAWKVGSGLSRVLEKSNASSLLKRSDHF